ATMALTCCSTVLIGGWSFCSLLKRGSPAVRAARPPAGAVLYGTPPGAANRVPGLRVIVFTGETGDPVMRFGSRLGSPCGVRPTASLARAHRAQALDTRKTPVRFVVMTASQSSGFMRSSSWSRVMAALLTSIVGSSPALSSSAIRASTDAALPASSTAPRPLHPCDARSLPSFAAPSAPVEVPITRAPAAPRASAIACPMPREAPVTSATSFSSMGIPPGCAQRRFDRGGIVERQKAQVRAPLDAAVEAGEHLSRAAFDDLREVSCRERAQRVRPAHRARELQPEELPDLLGPLVGAGIHRAHVADVGSAKIDRGELLSEPRGSTA